ncbi:mechanosensitive ion channel family protein, partial [Eubacteriales bacterium OttesenSCG-928-N14]|nr:mechanosensitive ion channel family protein [Eubacteriales bacterium OttesenSCG-928-N14]
MSEQLWNQVKQWLPNLGYALLVLLLGLWLSKYLSKGINKLMDKSHIDRTVKSFLHRAIRIILNIIVIISAAGILGIPVTTFVGMMSAATVAIGLAFRDSLSNVAAGILLMLSRPFAVGDNVIINSYNGVVQSIEIMYSTILTFDNKLIVMPNSTVIASTITNISARPTRRLELTVLLDSTAQPNAAIALMRDIVSKNKLAQKDPAPIIAIDSFG